MRGYEYYRKLAVNEIKGFLSDGYYVFVEAIFEKEKFALMKLKHCRNENIISVIVNARSMLITKNNKKVKYLCENEITK